MQKLRMYCYNEISERCGKLFLAAELGDYEEGVHTPGVISEFRFVEIQTEDLELAILEKFKTCRWVYLKYLVAQKI